MTVTLSQHFTLEELCASPTAKARGIPNNPSLEVLGNLQRLAGALEAVRQALGGLPLTIHSGYRSPQLNGAVGGQPNSYHLFGLAADFDPPGAMTHDQAQHAIAEIPDLDFDLVMEEGTAKSESEGGSRWLHFQIPKPGAVGRRLVRDALVDKLGGKIIRTAAG